MTKMKIEEVRDKVVKDFTIHPKGVKDAAEALNLARQAGAKGLRCRLEKAVMKNNTIKMLEDEGYPVVQRLEPLTQVISRQFAIGGQGKVKVKSNEWFYKTGIGSGSEEYCVVVDKLENYTAGVPMDLLKKAAECNKDFDKLEVWSLKKLKEIKGKKPVKDPILVGVDEQDVCAILGIWDEGDLDVFTKIGIL